MQGWLWGNHPSQAASGSASEATITMAPRGLLITHHIVPALFHVLNPGLNMLGFVDFFEAFKMTWEEKKKRLKACWTPDSAS